MRLALFGCVALLAGCGDVTVTQVNENGIATTATPKPEPGFYVPRLVPYLFVADLPPDQAPKPDTSTPAAHGGGHVNAKATTTADTTTTGDTTTGDKTATDKTSTPAGSASDMSFTALTKSYVIKLVYLPDYSHQQAVNVSSGWFGKASLQLQLVDGVPTSIGANSDNTENGELLKSAMTALITAATGGAAGVPSAAASAAGTHALIGGVSPTPAPPSKDSLLHPGIYQLVYTNGVFSGLHKVTGFCPTAGTGTDCAISTTP